MWRNGQAEPDIGKLVKIWETESHEKKVEVIWFFRPIEIANWLGDIKPLQREIFLACGHGRGLSNLAPLEAVFGKCNVLCSSKLKRNPQPTEEELRMADYTFYRTFDVRKCTISEKFPICIGGIEVDHFFNTKKDVEPKAYSKFRSEETPVKAMKNDQSARLEKVVRRYPVPDNSTSKQIKNGPPFAVAKVKYTEPVLSASVGPMKKRKLPLATLAEGRRDEKRLRDGKQHIYPAINYKYMEITRKPGMDSSKWFKLESEDIVRCIFQNGVKAKIVQCTALSSPHSGQAFIIFKTKEAADNVISRLNNGCLVLGDGKYLYNILKSSGKSNKYGLMCPRTIQVPGNAKQGISLYIRTEACGYFVMRYMLEIIRLDIVDSFEKKFNIEDPYSKEEIDDIRRRWTHYFLEVTSLA